MFTVACPVFEPKQEGEVFTVILPGWFAGDVTEKGTTTEQPGTELCRKMLYEPTGIVVNDPTLVVVVPT
jgi:hypothetical protein